MRESAMEVKAQSHYMFFFFSTVRPATRGHCYLLGTWFIAFVRSVVLRIGDVS